MTPNSCTHEDIKYQTLLHVNVEQAVSAVRSSRIFTECFTHSSQSLSEYSLQKQEWCNTGRWNKMIYIVINLTVVRDMTGTELFSSTIRILLEHFNWLSYLKEETLLSISCERSCFKENSCGTLSELWKLKLFWKKHFHTSYDNARLQKVPNRTF